VGLAGLDRDHGQLDLLGDAREEVLELLGKSGFTAQVGRDLARRVAKLFRDEEDGEERKEQSRSYDEMRRRDVTRFHHILLSTGSTLRLEFFRCAGAGRAPPHFGAAWREEAEEASVDNHPADRYLGSRPSCLHAHALSSWARLRSPQRLSRGSGSRRACRASR
jgi:hypothetical protein